MTKPLQKWKLPQPTDIKEDNEWIAIPRISRTIPFGYALDKDDPDILQPIENELNMLEEAKKYLKQYSYREVANWLSRNTGRSISHVGLKKRLDNERRRKNKVGSLRRWADYAKKAIAKAEEIDNKRLGAKAWDVAKRGAFHGALAEMLAFRGQDEELLLSSFFDKHPDYKTAFDQVTNPLNTPRYNLFLNWYFLSKFFLALKLIFF